MSIENDPSFWKQLSEWMWTLFALPLVWIWKRIDGSVQRDDFRDFIRRFDEHVENDREIQAKIFDKIDDLKTTILTTLK